MTIAKKTERHGIRYELINVLLLCARDELHFAYMKAVPWSRIPGDLLFLWQNEYPPEDRVLGKYFTKDERTALGLVQDEFVKVFAALSRGDELLDFDNEDFRTFQKEAQRALLVFPDKDVNDCYEGLKKSYGA